MQRRSRGFTLVELLMVVAIIGILAMIAIPNLINALSKAKQRRTMSDIRQIATAWEARATDEGRYNAAGSVEGASVPVAISDLATALEPTYIKQVPRLDGWSKEFVCLTDADFGGTTAAQLYAIISGGQDQVVSDEIFSGPFSNFDCDIVYTNGTFLTFPEGQGTSSSSTN